MKLSNHVFVQIIVLEVLGLEVISDVIVSDAVFEEELIKGLLLLELHQHLEVLGVDLSCLYGSLELSDGLHLSLFDKAHVLDALLVSHLLGSSWLLGSFLGINLSLLQLRSELRVLGIHLSRHGEGLLRDASLRNEQARNTHHLFLIGSHEALHAGLVLFVLRVLEKSSTLLIIFRPRIFCNLDAVFGDNSLQLDKSIKVKHTSCVRVNWLDSSDLIFDALDDVLGDARSHSLVGAFLSQQLVALGQVKDILIIGKLVVLHSVHQVVQLDAIFNVDLIKDFSLLNEGDGLSNLHAGSGHASQLGLHLALSPDLFHPDLLDLFAALLVLGNLLEFLADLVLSLLEHLLRLWVRHGLLH